MDETTTPLESGLGWTIAWEPVERQFVGRAALEALRGKTPRKLVGLLLEGPGVLRGHQKVFVKGLEAGDITSGSFSPTLNHSIAFARVPTTTGDTCQVDIRGRQVPARVVKPPFVRHGKSCID
jgi:aminomethyltransferase